MPEVKQKSREIETKSQKDGDKQNQQNAPTGASIRLLLFIKSHFFEIRHAFKSVK
jgi:hypothetical protein